MPQRELLSATATAAVQAAAATMLPAGDEMLLTARYMLLQRQRMRKMPSGEADTAAAHVPLSGNTP